MKRLLICMGLLGLCAGAPAQAAEIFGGIYAHDMDTPLNLRGIGRGTDFQIGWRGDRIEALRPIGAPSPYVLATVNSAGDTHYAAAGISWKIGGRLFVRPGLGLAVHTGPVDFDPRDPRRGYGSRILFEPELGVGYQLNDAVSVEASWIHMSHATLLARQNPGIDNIGLRVSYRFR